MVIQRGGITTLLNTMIFRVKRFLIRDELEGVGFVGNENNLIFFFVKLVYDLRSWGTYSFIEIIKNESSVLL